MRLRQLPGLDGLRAIAVVAVIVYHLDTSWLPGGYLGVDIFFVISGYLITALLLSEHQRSGGVALRRFWARRARRLLPAMGALLLGVTLLAAVFARGALGQMQGDVPASIFYVLNWNLVFSHDSYMASFGRPPLLMHLWSLSVEEQFYLLWPPALLLLRRRLSRSQTAALALGGALASGALMAVLFTPGTNPSGVYFATPTHAEGLLLGCALAAAIPPWRMSATVTPLARRVLERSGMAALVVMLAGLASFGFYSTFTYRGGMMLVDVATAVVIATVAHPASRLGAALGRQPLRWLGLRSYSLYLWHWPIFAMTRPGVDLPWPTFPDLLLRLALTVGAAELSYRYVEQPWRDGRAQFALRVRMASTSRPRLVSALAAPLALVALILATAPGPDEPAILATGSTAAARKALPAVPPTVPAPPKYVALRPTETRTVTRQPTPITVGSGVPPTTSPPTTVPLTPAARLASSEPILAIGDSVLLAASSSLNAMFGPDITVDAQVGRHVQEGLARLAAYRASGALARYRTVLVDLGTNGAFTQGQFTQMAALLAGVPHVVFFNVHAARSWAAPDNATIAAGVAAHRGWMQVVDWNVAAAAPGLLYPDGIHPNAAGAALYARLLRHALSHPSG